MGTVGICRRALQNISISHSKTPVAKALYEGWICKFGAPLIITTDQVRQFESHLYNALCKLMGNMHINATSYHLEVNGMVECIQRSLKAAIRCH